MDAVKAIIFDLDNTLFNENEYFYAVHDEFARRKNVDSLILKNTYQRIKLESEDIFGDILKHNGMYTPELQEEYFSLYKRIDTHLSLYEDAFAIIEWLKCQGHILGIITNGVLEAQKNKIRSLGIEDKFDTIIFAREFGKKYEKPSPKPFKYFLNKFNFLGKECIFVGDTYETDIIGAKKVGMQTMLIQRDVSSSQFFFNENKYIDYLGKDLYLLKKIVGCK